MKVTCNETLAVTTKRIFPADLNIYHTLFGGELLQQVDVNSSISVARFCHQKAFTVSVDHIDFYHPLLNDHAMTIRSMVSGCGTRSIETFSQVYGEDMKTGETYLAAQCFMTYALAKEVEATLPELVPESEFEKNICGHYQQRKQLNQQWRNEMPDKEAF